MGGGLFLMSGFGFLVLLYIENLTLLQCLLLINIWFSIPHIPPPKELKKMLRHFRVSVVPIYEDASNSHFWETTSSKKKFQFFQRKLKCTFIEIMSGFLIQNSWVNRKNWMLRLNIFSKIFCHKYMHCWNDKPDVPF